MTCCHRQLPKLSGPADRDKKYPGKLESGACQPAGHNSALHGAIVKEYLCDWQCTRLHNSSALVSIEHLLAMWTTIQLCLFASLSWN